jgi:hypothetical protein
MDLPRISPSSLVRLVSVVRLRDACLKSLLSAEFICDTLTNSCKANQAAKDVCAKARQAAAAAPVSTGAQADAFNGVFGIKTVSCLTTPYYPNFIAQKLEICCGCGR